ncbi:MAG TPA: hypothetical protein DDW20_01060 [Firmicutes bacterium]|nr:hypothetical protein [Bacillota bacterium]
MSNNSKNSVILLPSYQPEETLVNLTRGLSENGFYILIVDDGSGSDYKDIFKRCEKYADVISYDKNKGKGFALKTGFKYIIDKKLDYKFVITADGDGQHRIQDIVLMDKEALARNMTVIGERRFEVKTPFKSKIGNVTSRFTQALCTFRYMRDNQCGLRAFPTFILPELINISGQRYEYEMNVLTYLMTKEIPYSTMRVKTIYEDNNRTTHFRPVKDTLLIQGSILKCGLVNILSMIIGLVTCCLFYYFVFYNLTPNYELALFCSFGVSFLFHIASNMILYRPKNPAKMIFRIFLYEFFNLISLMLSVALFCRICSLQLYWVYLLSSVITIIPIYYLIKGIGLVYSSQYED